MFLVIFIAVLTNQEVSKLNGSQLYAFVKGWASHVPLYLGLFNVVHINYHSFEHSKFRATLNLYFWRRMMSSQFKQHSFADLWLPPDRYPQFSSNLTQLVVKNNAFLLDCLVLNLQRGNPD